MSWLGSFFNQVLYVQLSPQRLMVRDPRSGRAFDEVPKVAIVRPPNAKAKIVGIGAQAHMAGPNVMVVNPFAHPLSLLSDFTVAEQLLKEAVRRVHHERLFVLAPRFVIHPQGDPEGGFTQIEIRALQELGLGAGARTVEVWQGPALSDEELLSHRFPAGGRLLSA
ncbi:MAG: rod shape-determining protein [Betaproteobacteria bacterium]|nr:rod shape-determining protein [Betaproteobacteria bacterium]